MSGRFRMPTDSGFEVREGKVTGDFSADGRGPREALTLAAVKQRIVMILAAKPPGPRGVRTFPSAKAK